MVIQYPSLAERVAYPVVSENIDYSAVDGSIRAWYPFTRVQNTLTVYGMGVWRDNLYYVAGNKFYRYPTVLLGTLDDEPLITERAYFVPLADVLVVVVSGSIYLYDTTNGFRRLEQPPPPPTNTPTTERVLFTANRGTDYGGSATFTDNTNDYTLADVADNEPGAHRWFGISLPSDRPNYVSELSFRLLAWENFISTREHSAVELHANTSNTTQIARVVLPYPYIIGEHTIALPEPIRLDPSLRIRHFVRHRQTWRKQITFRAVSSPRHYAIARVVNGLESQPRYFDVSNAGANVNERYWVRFTSNLPSGTYRIYRADSAGVYRLVAQRNTNTAFTDWLADDELGERLVVQDYPQRADMAILYNRRAVLVDRNKVYVSAPARFSFASDDGSETIELHDTVIGLAVYNGILYVATRQGWYALLSGDTVYLQATQYAPPFVGYTGGYIYTENAGVMIGGDYPYRFLNSPIMDIVPCGDYRYLIDNTGKVYTQFHNGKITAMEGVYRGLIVYDGEIYAYGSDGIYKHSTIRGSARLKWTISFPQPANLYTLRVNGYGGYATLFIYSRDGNRSKYDTLPIKTPPRVEHDNYHLTLELLFSGNVVLEPPILVVEPRYQHTRGEE